MVAHNGFPLVNPVLLNIRIWSCNACLLLERDRRGIGSGNDNLFYDLL
jgi:hypothetical protein